MNQIIYPEKTEDNIIVYNNIIKNKHRTYKYLFCFSVVVLLLFIIYYIFLYFKFYKNDKISKNILEIYDIQTLYSSNISISLPSIVSDSGDVSEILGVLQIDKIDLRYPIISKTTDEFLEIAPCKFYGPNLNSYGNFCIAGHNYDNNELFSSLDMLELNDIITVYNLNGSLVSYKIYNIYESLPSDISCLEQNNYIREITLFTCNNQNNKRLIIKAKEIDRL